MGKKPSKTNFDAGKPLETRATMAAHGPGIQTVSILFVLAFLTSSSPGSQIFGIPASLTNAIDLPFVKFSMILGILFTELNLLKLIIQFLILNLLIIFFVCLVSSQAIKLTFSRILIALEDKSFKFPIGVPTIYNTPFSGSRSLCDNEELLFIS